MAGVLAGAARLVAAARGAGGPALDPQPMAGQLPVTGLWARAGARIPSLLWQNGPALEKRTSWAALKLLQARRALVIPAGEARLSKVAVFR